MTIIDSGPGKEGLWRPLTLDALKQQLAFKAALKMFQDAGVPEPEYLPVSVWGVPSFACRFHAANNPNNFHDELIENVACDPGEVLDVLQKDGIANKNVVAAPYYPPAGPPPPSLPTTPTNLDQGARKVGSLIAGTQNWYEVEGGVPKPGDLDETGKFVAKISRVTPFGPIMHYEPVDPASNPLAVVSVSAPLQPRIPVTQTIAPNSVDLALVAALTKALKDQPALLAAVLGVLGGFVPTDSNVTVPPPPPPPQPSFTKGVKIVDKSGAEIASGSTVPFQTLVEGSVVITGTPGKLIYYQNWHNDQFMEVNSAQMVGTGWRIGDNGQFVVRIPFEGPDPSKEKQAKDKWSFYLCSFGMADYDHVGDAELTAQFSDTLDWEVKNSPAAFDPADQTKPGKGNMLNIWTAAQLHLPDFYYQYAKYCYNNGLAVPPNPTRQVAPGSPQT